MSARAPFFAACRLIERQLWRLRLSRVLDFGIDPVQVHRGQPGPWNFLGSQSSTGRADRPRENQRKPDCVAEPFGHPRKSPALFDVRLCRGIGLPPLTGSRSLSIFAWTGAGFRTCLRAPGWSMVEATGRVCVNDDGPAIE